MVAVQRKAAEREVQRSWRAEMAARKEAKDRASQGPPKGQPPRWATARGYSVICHYSSMLFLHLLYICSCMPRA